MWSTFYPLSLTYCDCGYTLTYCDCGYRKHGISYYNPQLECWNTYCIPLEAAIKDGCQLLLFVITEDTRAMTSMIEV